MRVLVVGAGGFVGRHVLSRARAEGFAAAGTGRPGGSADLAPFELGRDDADRALRAMPGGGGGAAAVLCAAESRIDRCARDPEGTRRVNVDATIGLARRLAERGVRSIFLSTDHVFDGVRGGYDEGADPAPVNEYGRQKLAVETALRGLPGSLVLRLSRVVGDDPSEAHLFGDWLLRAERDRVIACVRGQVFSPTWVEDVATGVLAAVRLGLRGLYHLAAPAAWERAVLARRFVAALRLPAVVEEREAAAFGFADRRPGDTSLDGARLAAAAGLRFAPMEAIVDALRTRRAGGASR